MKNFILGFKEGQKYFGQAISGLVNSVLLGIVYFVAVGGTSIVAKMSGKKFINLNLEKDKNSYWEDLNLSNKKINSYYRQF